MDHVLGRLQEILKAFKNSENPRSAQLFAEDEAAKRILAAWPHLPLLIHEPLVMGTVPEHRANIWKYAWRFRKVDYRSLEDATGIEKSALKEKLGVLMAHQLVYPDGSLSQSAQTLVAGR